MSPAKSRAAWTAQLKDYRSAVRFSEAEARRLIRLYDAADKRARELLATALQKGNVTDYLASYTLALAGIRDELLAGARVWSSTSIPAVYLNAVQRVDGQVYLAGKIVTDADGTVFALEGGRRLLLNEVATADLFAAVGGVNQQAMKVLADATYQSLEKATTVIFRQVDDVFRALTLEHVRDSVSGLRSVDAVARRLRDDLIRQVPGLPAFEVHGGKIVVRDSFHAFIDKSGRRWRTDAYARMAARTATMEAHLAGTTQRLVELGEDVVQISTHSGSCPLCSPWQGKIVSLTGASVGTVPGVEHTIDEAREAGLFHPNCAHAASLYTPDFQAILDAQKPPTGAGAEEPETQAPGAAKPPLGADYLKNVDNATNRFEVEDVIRERFPKLDVDLSGCDLTSAKAAARGLGQADDVLGGLLRRGFQTDAGDVLPILPKLQTRPQGLGSGFSGAWAHTGIGGGVGLNPRHFGYSPTLLERLARCTIPDVSGFVFHPIGCTSIESIIVHEIGHSLDFWLGYWRGLTHVADKTTPLSVWKAKRWTQAQKNALSRYGATNSDERVAEAFASILFTPEGELSEIALSLRSVLPEIIAEATARTVPL